MKRARIRPLIALVGVLALIGGLFKLAGDAMDRAMWPRGSAIEKYLARLALTGAGCPDVKQYRVVDMSLDDYHIVLSVEAPAARDHAAGTRRLRTAYSPCSSSPTASRPS
jgi:hypothetical protein